MNSRRTLVYSCTAAIALVLSVCFWIWPRKPLPRHPKAESSAADFASRVAGVESELRSVRSILGRAQPPAAAAQAVETGEPASQSSNEEPSDDSAEQAQLSPEERDRVRVESTLKTLDSTLAREVADGVWEREAQQELTDLFSRQGFADSQLGRVRCAQTLCKISILHRDREAWKKFIDSDGLIQPPFRSSSGFSHHSDTTNETVVFITRKGQHLPETPGAG